MKMYRSVCVLIAVLMLGFGSQAYAATAREDLVHAYVLLKMANSDYGGHRGVALKQLEDAGHDMGLDLKGRGTEHERQMKSDEQVAEAGRILRDVRNRLEARDREHAAARVDRAIEEINKALKVK
jgi:hypothetical protein